MKCKNCCHFNVCSKKEIAEEANKKIESFNSEFEIFQVNLSCKEFLINPKTATEPFWGAIKTNVDKVGKVGKACKDIYKEEYSKDKEQ